MEKNVLVNTYVSLKLLVPVENRVNPNLSSKLNKVHLIDLFKHDINNLLSYLICKHLIFNSPENVFLFEVAFDERHFEVAEVMVDVADVEEVEELESGLLGLGKCIFKEVPDLLDLPGFG